MRPCQGGVAPAGRPRAVPARATAAALVHGLLLVLPLYVVLEARLELCVPLCRLITSLCSSSRCLHSQQ